MRLAKIQAAIVAVTFGGALLACNALIGTKDIFFDADGGGGGISSSGGEGGTIESGAPDVNGSSSGSEGGGTPEASADGSCQANLQLDKANCGACGHDCLGGDCTGGKCQPFALVKTGGPRYIALDATNIYYTDDSLNALRKIPKAGGNPSDVCTIANLAPDSLAIDATNAYFAAEDGNGDGAIEKCPLDGAGGAAAAITASQKYARSLVLAGTDLFWVQATDPPIVTKMTLGGAAATFYTGPAGATVSLDVGGTDLLMSDDQGGGKLLRCPLAGPCATPETVATDTDGIDGALLTSARLLWATGVWPGTIWQSQPDGGGAAKVTVGNTNQTPFVAIPHTLRLDQTHLYFLNAGKPDPPDNYVHGSVMRCGQTNGVVDCGASGPEALGSEYAFIRGLVVDTNAIYWVEGVTIWRLAK